MKYIRVHPEQVASLYKAGVQLLLGVIPCTSLEQALANPDKIYVRPRMSPERFAEYIRVRNELETLQQLKAEIEADIESDGEIAFYGNTSKTAIIELGGFNLEMTRSDKVQISDSEDATVSKLLNHSVDYITSKTVYSPTSALKSVLVILHNHTYSATPYADNVQSIYDTYLGFVEERKAQGVKQGRKTELATFDKSLRGTHAKRVKFLESKGFETSYADSISIALEGPLNGQTVNKLLEVMKVEDVNAKEVMQLLSHFAINTVISFSVR